MDLTNTHTDAHGPCTHKPEWVGMVNLVGEVGCNHAKLVEYHSITWTIFEVIWSWSAPGLVIFELFVRCIVYSIISFDFWILGEFTVFMSWPACINGHVVVANSSLAVVTRWASGRMMLVNLWVVMCIAKVLSARLLRVSEMIFASGRHKLSCCAIVVLLRWAYKTIVIN